MNKIVTNSEKGSNGPLQPHPPELKERGYRLYEQGKSNSEIAKELGIPLSTLARWSSKNKWKLRKHLGRIDARRSKHKPTDAQSNTDALTFTEKQTIYREGSATQALRILELIQTIEDEELLARADKIEKLDKIARKALNLEQPLPAVVVNVAMLAGGDAPRIARELPSNQTLTLEESTKPKPLSEET
jgi:transposase-like protein